MEFAKRFEDLRVWQDARSQAGEIYRAFGNGTPAVRDFGFRDQIQRAAVSVMNNVAEGFERRSPAEFSRFLDTAKSSCGEVRSMLYLAEDLAYLEPESAEGMRLISEKLSRALASLDQSVRQRIR